MRRFCILVVILCHLFVTKTELQAQAWAGIIDTNRAWDWANAGVAGGIPSATWANCDNAKCTAIAPGGTGGPVNSTTLNDAIASAQVGGSSCSSSVPCVVRVRAGTFALAEGFSVLANYRVVRGAGADQTKFTVTGQPSFSCGLGGWQRAINLCTNSQTDHFVSWTAGYSIGTTSITLASHTNLTVGDPIWLAQNDDTSGGDYPAVGDVLICQVGANTSAAAWCSSQGGGSDNYSPWGVGGNVSHFTGYTVVSCGTTASGAACTSNTIGLDHGIATPDYRAAKSPQAYYQSTDNYLRWVGVEDLSFDWSALGSGAVGIQTIYGFNVWERGVRSIAPVAPAATPHHFVAVRSDSITLQSNYWFGPEGTAGATNQYALSAYFATRMRIENNIIQQRQGALITDSPWSQSVFAYNFFPGRTDPGLVHHSAGDMMDLSEGNVWLGYYTDIIHGTTAFNTSFRNAMMGHRYSSNPFGTIQDMVHLEAQARFYNIIGNVMGDPAYITTYETTLAQSGVSIYDFGWQGNATICPGCILPNNDTNVKRTIMRWGNWDTVSNATRWCGNSSNTGWVAVCGSVTEVPSGITNFSNAIPATETLPASLYLPSQPAWWRSGIPYPAIGPDVTGGNISNMGGHAYLNPAADCALNVMGIATDGSSAVSNFNATTCYAATVCTTPSKLAFTTQPSSASLNATIGTVAVSVEDASGNVCTNDVHSVTLSKSGGATWGTLATTSSLAKTAVAGIATWTSPDLSVTTTAGAGTITAAATTGGLTSATSNSITISTPSVSFSSIANATAATGSSITISGVAVIAPSPVVVVGVTLNSSTATVTGVSISTGSGTSAVVNSVRNVTAYTSVWCLAAPTVGTGTVTVTLSASVAYQATATVYINASQTAPCPAANSVTGSSSAASIVLTPTSVSSIDAEVGTAANTVSDNPTGFSSNYRYASQTTSVNIQSGDTLGTGALTAAWDASSGRHSGVGIRVVGSTCTPDHLAFTMQPADAILGAGIGTVAVAVQDSSNATCSSDTSTVTITRHTGSCVGMTLTGTTSGAAVSGVFTTANMTLTGSTGSCSLDANDGPLTGAVSNTITISATPQPGGSGAPIIKVRP